MGISMRKFKIGSEEIVFDDDFEFYNHYANDLFTLAYESMYSFKNEIIQIDNIQGLIEETPEIANEKINEAVSYCIDILIENEVYDYDVDRFWEDFGEDLDYEESDEFQELYEEYQSIQNSEQALQEEKTSYRNARGRWVGGGFGISGAIKGAVQAGAMNMVTGAFRGIADSFVDASDRKKFSKMRNALLTEENIENLAEGLWYIIAYSVSQSLAEILEERTGRNADEILGRNEDEAAAIFNNLDRVKDQKKRQKLVKKIIELDPYNLEYLEGFESNCCQLGLDYDEFMDIFRYLNRYGSEGTKLFKIGEAVEKIVDNTDLSTGEKRDQITKLLMENSYIDADYKILVQNNSMVMSAIIVYTGVLAIYEVEEERAQLKKEKGVSYKELLGFKTAIEDILRKYRILKSQEPIELKEEYVDMLADVIETLNETKRQIRIEEKKLRTVNGKEFSSIEEAECYKKELTIFDTLNNKSGELKTSQQFAELIQALKNENFKNKEFCDQIIQLEEKQKFLEKAEREERLTVGKVKFETFEEAESYRKEKRVWDRKVDSYREKLGSRYLTTQDIELIYKELSAESFTSKVLQKKLNIIRKMKEIYQQADIKESEARQLKEKLYIICGNCGERIYSEGKYCPMCGKPLITKIKCPKCGYYCDNDSRFCGMCGTKLL